MYYIHKLSIEETEDRTAVQGHFYRLEKNVDGNIMKLNENKRNVLPLRWHAMGPGDNRVRKYLCRKGPGDSGREVKQESTV